MGAPKERDLGAATLRYFVGRADVLIWRNNTGLAFTPNGTPIRFGLVGSADYIGLRTVRVTPEMLGTVVGQFLGLETKIHGRKLTKEQTCFGESVTMRGGLYVPVYSIDDVAREVPPCA